MPTLTLIRGLPGSGKSTLANALRKDYIYQQMRPTSHYEADMYFIKDGKYQYDKTLIQRAHSWCLDRTSFDLERGIDVIVSNTFTQIWQMEPYLQLCRDKGYTLNVIECKGQFGNIHNVPEGSLIRFREQWEDFPCQ